MCNHWRADLCGSFPIRINFRCTGLAFYLFACCVVWLLAKFYKTENSPYRPMSSIVFIFMGLMVGNVPIRIPSESHERFVFVILHIFCLNWISAYTSSLISAITTPLHTNKVSSSKLTTYSF